MSRFEAPVDRIAHERVDGEVIVIHLATGNYYSLSETAADVWTLLTSGFSPSEATTALGQLFDSKNIEKDVDELASQLVGLGLLEKIDADVPKIQDSLPDDYTRGRWSVPILQTFEDLQDLILVDPIHDVNRLGWPHVDDGS